tara:strand:+ start:8573 stop:9220 length:648 start_codon:yes stop_codon:yes gene_type:complete
MRGAVCLYGLSTGKNDKGDVVSHTKAASYLKKNVLDIQDEEVVVFLHTWNEDAVTQSEILDLYKSKASKQEKQIMFDDTPTKLHQIKSRWYSHKESINLKKQYEEEHGPFDFVLVSRFDNCFLLPFKFGDYKKGNFYSSNWKKPHSDTGFLDYWFFSDSSTMDRFSTLYDNLDTYLREGKELSNHTLALHHAEQQGLKVKTTKTEYVDFGLERCI